MESCVGNPNPFCELSIGKLSSFLSEELRKLTVEVSAHGPTVPENS